MEQQSNIHTPDPIKDYRTDKDSRALNYPEFSIAEKRSSALEGLRAGPYKGSPINLNGHYVLLNFLIVKMLGRLQLSSADQWKFHLLS